MALAMIVSNILGTHQIKSISLKCSELNRSPEKRQSKSITVPAIKKTVIFTHQQALHNFLYDANKLAVELCTLSNRRTKGVPFCKQDIINVENIKRKGNSV